MKVAWTKEQQEAIDIDGSNILVSAGAGSGKTAVLTERVIRKLRSGTHINELLIVTFTKASAFEMKERIKKAITKDPSLKLELALLDEAYITTFDSFTLSLVKKYHYQKNLVRDIKICDSSLLTLEKKKMCTAVLENALIEGREACKLLIHDYCLKSTKDLEEFILKIVSNLDYVTDKDIFLDTYIDNFYSPNKVDEYVTMFVNYLKEDIQEIFTLIDDLSLIVDGDYTAKLQGVFTPLKEATTYDAIVSSLPSKLPILRGAEEEAKALKDEINQKKKDLVALCIYESEESLRSSYLKTKVYAEEIIYLVKNLVHQIKIFKEEHSMYEFSDIAHLAISLLKENEEIRKEVSNSFKEILIDEYQDTNDIQEALMSLIIKDNNYMVGDIKQSIYRFRNANPYIFKTKYDNYAHQKGGRKIDLVKNFRSRREVLDDINTIFEDIMDDFLGGASYKEGHAMVFGNTAYEVDGATLESHKVEIYQYSNEDTVFTKAEIEAFKVAQDIQSKIASNYQIFDKDQNILRKATYSDFAILMDRSTSFPLYKQIFEYFHIPMVILQDDKLTTSLEVHILKNLFKLVVYTKNKKYDESFKHALASVARSFLVAMSDDEVYHLINDNLYFESSIYNSIKPLVMDYATLGAIDVLNALLNNFNYYEKLITLGNIEEGLTRIFYIKKLVQDLTNNGYSIEDVLAYLEDVLESKLEIKYKASKEAGNAVKIMTIHTSKGLEYPICYFTGLSSSFNTREIKSSYFYDRKFGLVLPYREGFLKKSFVLELVKRNYMEEEISEKIRLFYVALTRAKEKMILILPAMKEKPLLQDNRGVIVNMTRLKYRSFAHMLESIYEKLIPFLIPLDIKSLGLTKLYLRTEPFTKEATEELPLDVSELNIQPIVQEKTTFSKSNISLLTKEENESRLLGSKFHEILEYIDFDSPELLLENEEPFLAQKVRAFINHDFFKSKQIEKVVREYSFIMNDTIGRIDLLLFTKDIIYLIDYKLKKINDSAYQDQLKGYISYLQTQDVRPVKAYLYSILEETFYEVEG